MILHPSEISVPPRIREEFDEDALEALAQSMKALGQLQPILVGRMADGKYPLTAGERRIRAIQKLATKNEAVLGRAPGDIWAEFADSTDPRIQLQMEFDENNQRADFNFVEKAKFIRRYHETMVKEYGEKWTQEYTAAALRLNGATISYYLRIEEAVKSDPSVAKATTVRSAIKRMKVTEAHKVRRVEVEDNAPEAAKRAQNIILLGDARELIKAIPDSSVDCINFDPPWGDETGRKSNENWDGFKDDTETSDDLINTLLPELYRVLKNDRMMIYWYRTWAYSDMIARLEHCNCNPDLCGMDPAYKHEIGFNLKFTRTPCIWFKPDKVSDQNRFPEKQLISSYETFLIARKGEPLYHVQGHQDVFSHNRVPISALIHPTEKPVSLCSELLSLTTIPGEMVLDPTAGSGSFLFSALLSGRRPLGFENSETIRDRSLVRIAEHLRNVK